MQDLQYADLTDAYLEIADLKMQLLSMQVLTDAAISFADLTNAFTIGMPT